MPSNNAPGANLQEKSNQPSPIVSVQTAVPAFVGYTQKAGDMQAGKYLFTPKEIRSLLDYERYFGFANPETSITVTVDTKMATANATITNPSPYLLYYALQLFFANGGRRCYVVSVGDYASKKIDAGSLQRGLAAVAKTEEVTLLLFPDAFNLPNSDLYYGLYKMAMQQCVLLRNRFAIMDVWTNASTADPVATLRAFDFGGTENLRYAAAYYPRIFTNIPFACTEKAVAVKATGDASLSGTLAQLAGKNKTLYPLAKEAVGKLQMLLPSSPAVAGIYAQTDDAKGVWKAPANVNINAATAPEILLSDAQQERLNVDAVTGKSINAIRRLTGRGQAVVWGSRTLAGNDNDWRYVPVRRFFIAVETSLTKGTAWVVFEPNNQATWSLVRASVENYLTQQWHYGALMGTKPSEAFYVRVGLGQTMTQADLLEGKLIIEVGMAVVRPAEFILLRIAHKTAVS